MISTIDIHIFYYSLLLGLGAAAPLGPVNFEIIRRNLDDGFKSGTLFGLGACCADLTYLVLLVIGIISFFKHPIILNVVGIVGSFVIAWFGWRAVRSAQVFSDQPTSSRSLLRNIIDGYLMTLVNPYTILFWASVSAQIANFGRESPHAIAWGGVGVLVGTFSWVVGLNGLMQLSRRVMSAKIIRLINVLGGLLLIGIALYGLIHSILSLRAL